MILPGGKILHKNLSTYYTRSQQLMNDLQEMRFSGYLQLSFWEYEGIIVFDTGKIVQIYVDQKNKLISGPEALRSILDHIGQKDGVINVFTVEPEPLMVLTSFKGSVVSNQSDNLKRAELDTIIQKALDSEEIGIIDLQFGRKQGKAALYFSGGSIVSAVLQSESGRTVNDHESTGLLDRIYDLVEKINTKSTCYYCHPGNVLHESSTLQDWFNFFDFIYFLNQLNKYMASLLKTICKEPLLQDFAIESIILLRDEYGFPNLQINNFQFENFESNLIESMRELYFIFLQDLMAKIEDIHELNRSALRMGVAPFFELNKEKLMKYQLDNRLIQLLES